MLHIITSRMPECKTHSDEMHLEEFEDEHHYC